MHLPLLAAVALVTATTAFRKVKSRKGDIGTVDALYTWGSPASAKPGLTNMRGSNPCFPGLRTVTVTENRMDAIPKLARIVFYEHPMMDSSELNVHTNVSTRHECSSEAARLPQRFWPTLSLHMPWKYTFHLDDWHTFNFNVSMIGCWLANAKDFPILGTRVKEGIEAVGWKLVARAFAPANFLQGGDQYSILTQHPETLDCMVTFQRTLSLRDVFIDLDARERAFCDLPDTVVHKGFRDHLRNMVRGEWQTLVRPHLPSCAKVYIAGMSLGGAMAELFSACVQRAPADDEDFNTFSWIKGRAQQLPYL